MRNIMKYNFRFLLLILLSALLLLSACARNVELNRTAQSYYKRGDYANAVRYAAQSLQLKPNYVKAQNVFRDAYYQVTMDHRQSIRELSDNEDESRWEKLVVHYAAMEEMRSIVTALPPLVHPKTGVRMKLDVFDYTVELKEAQQNAAEYHYQKGIHFSMTGSEAAIQKQAAGHFKQAMSYIPNYKDSATRYEEARSKAVRRIAVISFDDRSNTKDKYGILGDLLADQIISGILQDKENTEFIELITRDRINQVLAEQKLSASGLVDENSAARIGVLLGAHEIMSGRVLQVNYTAPRTTSVKLTETANIEVEKENEDDPDKVEISCEYNKFIKTASAQILGSYSLVDVATGRIIAQETFTAEENFEDTWARVISGDARALSPADKALVAKTEPYPPQEKTMVNTAMGKLSRSIVSHFLAKLK